MTEHVKFIRKNSKRKRENARKFYEFKYFNLFLNAFEFDNLDEEQTHFLLEQLWLRGRIAVFKIDNTATEENPSGEIALAPFSPKYYNIYNYPTKLNLINLRNAPFIPKREMVVNDDVVIGYAQRDHLSVIEHIEDLIDKLVELEMLFINNINTQKMPYLIACSPEDKKKLNDIVERILNDEDVVFTDAEDVKNLKIMVSGAPFILDKINGIKDDIENKIKEYLGIDNADFKKKEYINVDDTNSNNDMISKNGDVFLKELEEFCERVTDVLGYPLSVKPTRKPIESLDPKEKDEEDKENDE